MRRLLLLLLLLLSPAPLRAQVGATTDILRGRVTDAEGNPVPGALVEAVSVETGVRRNATADNEGRYTILFPDGGGRYRLRVSFIGAPPVETTVSREGDEETLRRDVRLATRPVDVEGVTAQGRRAPPGRGEAGSLSRGLSNEVLNRMPLENTDPASLASLTPGVVTLGDSLGGAGSFSIAGQRSSQNQVTLDGATFASMLSGGAMGGSPLGLPQEGMRSTQVITSTYDVARGQFSGGQIAMSTRGGTNTHQGSFSYQLRDDLLQGGAGRTEWADGFRMNRFSGGVGGPIAKDRLFYNLSLSGQRRNDDLFALEPRSASGFPALGASRDSASRFLDILERQYGIPLAGQTGAYSRGGDAVSALARVDWTASQRHTLSGRAFAQIFDMTQAFIRPLDLMENGGEMANRAAGAVGTLTSRIGGSWINELRASYTGQESDVTSGLSLPEGRVRSVAALDEGGTGIATYAFGGDPFPPRGSAERTIEVADELSLLLGSSHRLKLGALYNRTAFEQQTAFSRNGVFTFESLADFEAGRASSYTRSLVEGPTEGSGWNAALYLGDTWRATDALQIVYGVRAEGSGFGESPLRNAAVEEAFGVRTDLTPSETRLSPRLGFSWRLSEPGTPLRLLRGGFGEFRGRTPYSLYAGALDAGRGAESLLSCAGEGRVPAADFSLFRRDPSAVPTTCADGTSGTPATAGRPTATAFAEDFAAPRSWRASLGLQTSLPRLLTASVDASYSRGLDQYGVRDLNLGAPAFTLAGEGGRPVYAAPGAIDPRSAAIPLQASRRDPRFSNVYEVGSELESEAASVTFGVQGLLLPWRVSFQSSYTLGWARDQSSFAFGGAPEGFARTPTAGDPNRPGWAASDQDRRHMLTALVGMPFRSSWELSLVGRAMSGAPFTPRVGGDVNGDGARNDAAFVFDPAAVTDPSLRAGMERLLEGASGGAAECLREQRGRVAERNSCRGDWSYSLDLRAAYTPRTSWLGRRLSLAAELYNLPAGLDLALHDGRRGWGQGGWMQDDVLLYPRGFDPATRSYRYEVNERFGRNLARAMGQRSPFGVQVSARLAVGPEPGPDPLGGFAGLGMGGGGEGGPVRVMVTAGGPGGAGGPPPGGGGEQIRIVRPGEGGPMRMGPGGMLERMLPMPFDSILAMRDSLGLSGEQVERIEVIRDSVTAVVLPVRAEMGAALNGLAPTDNPGAVFDRIGPKLNQARQSVQKGMDDVKAALTAEQWEKIPERIRNTMMQGNIRIRGG